MTLDYLVRNVRSALPTSVWVGGRTVFNRFVFMGDTLNEEETSRIYLHDTQVGSVRVVIDFHSEYKPNLLVLGNLASSLRVFFGQQHIIAVDTNPLKISTISGQPVVGVCPVCRNGSLGIFADCIAPIPDSLTGEVAIGDSLLIQELGCANYEVNEHMPLTGRGALHTSNCFDYNLYGSDTQVPMSNQLEIDKPRAIADGLGRWANLLVGMCRAGNGVI